MKKINHLILITALVTLTGSVYSQSNPEVHEKASPFSFEAAYLGDFVGNVKGGIQTGFTYMGLLDLGLGFDIEKAGLWKGGDIYLRAQNTHGGFASGDYIGDLQVLSNIENGNYTYLYELWYRQSIGKFSIQAGVNDLNSDFAVCESGGRLMNSAFGIHSSIPLNFPVSIFPKTTLGLKLMYYPTDRLTMRMALYDGDPGSLEDDPHNLNWTINREDGLFAIGEVQYDLYAKENQKTVLREGILIGSYKLGAYYHSGTFESLQDGSPAQGNYGAYFLADQVLIRRSAMAGRSARAFLQAGWNPAEKNVNNFYLGAGIKVNGLLFGRHEDEFSFGVAYAKIKIPIPGNTGEIIPGIVTLVDAETAIELNYKVQIWDVLAIQPGLHYIVNPGVVLELENAVVPAIRFEIGI